MGDVVDIDFRKWDGSQHWRFPGRPVGEDDHGVWLGVAPGDPFTGPRGDGVYTWSFVVLVPREAWWAASFNDGHHAEVYVDIATRARWLSATHVQMVDLDLDVIRYRDGRLLLDDEDEFACHQVSMSYPRDVVENARASADRLMHAVGSGAEPFGDAGAKRLAEFVASLPAT